MLKTFLAVEPTPGMLKAFVSPSHSQLPLADNLVLKIFTRQFCYHRQFTNLAYIHKRICGLLPPLSANLHKKRLLFIIADIVDCRKQKLTIEWGRDKKNKAIINIIVSLFQARNWTKRKFLRVNLKNGDLLRHLQQRELLFMQPTHFSFNYNDMVLSVLC